MSFNNLQLSLSVTLFRYHRYYINTYKYVLSNIYVEYNTLLTIFPIFVFLSSFYLLFLERSTLIKGFKFKLSLSENKAFKSLVQ